MASLHKKASGKLKRKNQILDLIHKAEKMRLNENIDESIIYLNQAKKKNNKVGDQYLEALILEGFGFCYETSDNYEKAIRNATDAIVIFQKLPGPEGRLGNANGLISLGNIYARLGRYKKAIGYQEEAIQILLKMRKEAARGQRQKKTIKKALEQENITIQREKFLGIAYGNMGQTYNELKDYEKGIRLSLEALQINKKSGDKFEEARNLLNIGNAYGQSGAPKKSIEYCEESARISIEIGNKQCECSSYGVLATSYMTLGDVATSKRYYQMSIDINVNMNQCAELAIVYGNYGLLNCKIGLRKFLSFGDAEESLEYSVENFKLAIESTDKVLTSLSVDDNRTAFSDRFYRWYDELTAPFNLLGRSAAALLFLDLGRAKILRQLVYKQVNPKENHEDQSTLESSWLTIQNKKEKERICALTEKIQLLESDATVVFYNFNRAEILTIWILDADGRVFLKTSDPGENFSTAQEELENNLKKMLDQGSVVLPRGYSFFNPLAVVDTKAKDVNCRVETASHEESHKEVTERDYRSPAKRSDKTCDDLAKETRSSLYRALISPVKSFIKGAKLIIVPQRCLFFAPFSSFIDENGCVLSEKYQIQIIPSIHVLAMSIQSSSGMPIGGSLFVGDPEVQLAGLSRLPCAAEEVQYLASLLDSKPLLGPMATKSKVLELMPEASIIHVAAHAHEQAGDIFLAPGSSKSTAYHTSSSYLLTQSDILKCNLTARLVVLSCCNTGKGQVSSEGVLGIARSFLGAGASSVLVTLWRIYDKFTKLFMTVFYEKILEEKSACLALKETMNQFRRSEEYKSFTFWAAFEIMGEDVRFSEADIEEIRRNNKLKILTKK